MKKCNRCGKPANIYLEGRLAYCSQDCLVKDRQGQSTNDQTNG